MPAFSPFTILRVLIATLCLGGLAVSDLQAQERLPGSPQPGEKNTPSTNPFERRQEQEQPAATEDNTSALAHIPQTPEEIVNALGYPFLVPFMLASIIALWFTIERMVVLRRGRVIPRPFVERFLQHLSMGQLDPATALHLCDQSNSPVSNVFAHGIRKWGKPSVEVEQAIIDGGERQVSMLRKNLRVLNGVATITPLIGLLGTVIGMIHAFNELANTNPGEKAQQLAIGIGLALLTTAIGLAIAIPSLIMYMYLTGKVDSLVIEMDDLAQNVVNMISAEALSSNHMAESVESPPPKTTRTKKTTSRTA